MKIQTFSIVVGTRACDAKCPFCVSKMTGFDEMPKGHGVINERNFHKAARLAEKAGTTTVLMTGKGEPTLYPAEITRYLELLQKWDFPLIEIQTNGLVLGRTAKHGLIPEVRTLHDWYDLGLDTIALSVVDICDGPIGTSNNALVYMGDREAPYPQHKTTVDFLHEIGFSVRLCVMMQKGMVDSPRRVCQVIDFCRENKIEQLTIRPLRAPERTDSTDASRYVSEHGLTWQETQDIADVVGLEGTRLMTLMHGARVYDVEGQNVCVSDCLTVDPTNSDLRTLIFYSNGRVTYDWQYEGAVLLGGKV